jgi:Major capsid protein N-terminus/Large eukaryotic DNA virus major capsid protein
MTGGIIQLVAYGNEDLFLTRDPQITFFKVIYRRHTNFAREEVRQDFINDPDFDKRSSCVISGNADMANRMALRIVLPSLPKITDSNGNLSKTKVAWIKYIGQAMIRSVEVEIGGRIIDRHYGEWMYLFSQLTTRNITDRSIDRLVGNVPELTDFTNGKDEYVLYVPLHFWFCRSSGLSIPLVALHYSEVRINVEFRALDELIYTTPTHYIRTVENIVNFKEGEYLIQRGDDKVERYGMFSHFDPIEKKLFYTAVSSEKLIGVPFTGLNLSTLTTAAKESILSTPKSDRYVIRGISSEYFAKPDLGVKSFTTNKQIYRNVKLKECQLLVDYIYLDDDERFKIVNSKHDYLIEQLYYTPNIIVDGTNRKAKLVVDQPCKLLVWVAQLDYIERFNDQFNYTDTHVKKLKFDFPVRPDPDSNYTGYEENNNLDPVLDAGRVRKYEDKRLCESIGEPLIAESTILFNSQERMTRRVADYYENLQPYQHSRNVLPTGVNMYSFAINPFDVFPSGTTNMSQIEEIDIQLRMNFKVSINNKAKFRAYGLCYNVWRVNNGLSASVFIR